MSVPAGADFTERPETQKRLALLRSAEVALLPGVGTKGAARLRDMGIENVLDLVMCYPRRHADRTYCREISELVPGDEATVRASVERVELRRARGRKPFVSLRVGDSGHHIQVTFFNQPWRARQLEVGMDLVLYGKVDAYRSNLSMVNPRVDIVGGKDQFRETGRIVPIYRASDKAGVASYQMARFVARALSFADEHDAFADPISDERLEELGLFSRSAAFHAIHNPESMDEYERAKRRLAFDELWRLQVALVMRKLAAQESARGIAHVITEHGGLVSEFVDRLPFPLTAAQQRAIREIASDLRASSPMHRLLQGDVGSGKTVVALAALLHGVQGGHQGALMVPTSVLAEQHFLAAKALLTELEVDDPSRLSGRRLVTVALLTSNTPAAERSRLLLELAAREIDLLVGTHALLTDDVQFSSLGVVVVDEQHRFGVDQRAALREKGSVSKEHDPDVLVMTATPIPRTAAMTVYGDLDLSILDELPAGRSPIVTRWVADEKGESQVWDAVRTAVVANHAAYVVCPLVRGDEREEGDDDDIDRIDEEDDGRLFSSANKSRVASDQKRALRAAVQEYERLRTDVLKGVRVGLIHGQLSSREKEAAMEAFRVGEIDVLVATVVIEVGIDVSRATVMVIEDADRFGIAQLHQLRGRVGRGDEPSQCFLLATEVTELAEERLRAVEESTDGFVLAEVDLGIRGEGTVLGARQKGRSDLRLASIARDRDLVVLARRFAEEVVAKDPHLERHRLFAEELRALIGEEEAAYLFRN